MLAHVPLPTMVRIPAGRFTMGARDGAADEGPAHEVELDAYQLSAHPVTNAEYERFLQDTGHRAPSITQLPLIATLDGRQGEQAFREMCADYVWRDGHPPEHRRTHPVTLVRWDDTVAYCEWLTGVAGAPMRLPTEAEWEHAARGGSAVAYPTGDTIDTTQANYLDDPSTKRARGTTGIGAFAPNGFGLHDMAGNVWEWVEDWYDPAYYASAPLRNPTGPVSGRFRVVRGGGWVTADPRALRVAHRHHVPVDTYSYSIGFRVAGSASL